MRQETHQGTILLTKIPRAVVRKFIENYRKCKVIERKIYGGVWHKKIKLITVRFQKIVRDKNFACLRKHEKYAGVDSQGNNPQAKFIQGYLTLEGFSGRSFARGFFLRKFPWKKLRQI